MHHLLPVSHLEENADWMMFHHPQPAYPLYILILRKRGFSTLNDVKDHSAELYNELFKLVKPLIKRFDLDPWGCA
jgi:diadenosine tetraphosphate (Ap4A) HIT family hydrolase